MLTRKRRNNARRIWACTPQNCATTNQFFVYVKCLFSKAINRLTTNLNFANLIPFHNPVLDVFARDLVAIRSRSAFRTNVNLNRSNLSVFARSYALSDCNGYSSGLCNSVFHCALKQAINCLTTNLKKLSFKNQLTFSLGIARLVVVNEPCQPFSFFRQFFHLFNVIFTCTVVSVQIDTPAREADSDEFRSHFVSSDSRISVPISITFHVFPPM